MCVTHVVLAILLALGAFVALAPADAQAVSQTTSSHWSGSSYGFDLVVSVNETTKIPAGRLTIWFSDREGGPAEYWYLGGSKIITVPHIDAFKYCMFRVDLQGTYKDNEPKNPVQSSWENVSGEKNIFYAPVNGGENEAQVWIGGKHKTSLKILFWSVGIASKTVWSADGFRVFDRTENGLTDLKAQREIAAARWPGLSPADWDLWSRMWVYETHYLSQGLISAGTEDNPVVSTATLRELYDLRQKRSTTTGGPAYIQLEVGRLDVESGKWVSVVDAPMPAPSGDDSFLTLQWPYAPGRCIYRWGGSGEWREIWGNGELNIPAPMGQR